MNFLSPLLLFLILLVPQGESQLLPAKTSLDSTLKPLEFVVWNVGQGSWASSIENDLCLHFDSGGEHAPFAQIKAACGEKKNQFYFSHWDWDHIRFVRRLPNLLRFICVSSPPAGQGARWKKDLFSEIPLCRLSKKREASELKELKTLASGGANEASRVFFLRNKFILPGDSTAKAEKIWSTHLGEATQPRILVLGHHGSQTSTTAALLQHLRDVRQAIASSDSRKYGHPHRSVRERLRQHGIALLRTEHWGSIHFIEIRRERSTATAKRSLESL